MNYPSWGNYPPSSPASAAAPFWTDEIVIPKEPRPVLAYGLGRSYGDSCLNNDGSLIVTEHLDRILSFDTSTGLLCCEAGISLADLLKVIVPRGWFLPVTPGTKFVTVGGAIANDVHGKNHHVAGTFGRHISEMEILQSDGSRTTCSPSENEGLFAATIGGLGLTGIILKTSIQLKPIHNPFVDVENITFTSLDEFFELSEQSADWEYTVAWLDTTFGGGSSARGIFMRGRHSGADIKTKKPKPPPTSSVPLFAPNWLLNSFSVSAFNWAYYHKQRSKIQRIRTYYEPFFYPLDAVHHWNRIYGKRGFLQFQCVVPTAEGRSALAEIINRVTTSKRASFLAVIKEFGSIDSPGMLSFPRPGTTACLDFPFQGAKTLSFFAELEKITRDAGGALYPAKDACMLPETFRASYPHIDRFLPFIDQAFSSSFWRRVMEDS